MMKLILFYNVIHIYDLSETNTDKTMRRNVFKIRLLRNPLASQMMANATRTTQSLNAVSAHTQLTASSSVN